MKIENEPNQIEIGNYWDAPIDEAEAANFLKLSTRTLQAYRYAGGGPVFIRISARCIRYRRADLKKWIDLRIHQNTSEYQPEV